MVKMSKLSEHTLLINLFIALTKKDSKFRSTFRERDKVIRGFKSEDTANQFIDNWKTYYNFVKPHMTFNGLTPSEVAGISIGADRNKWLNLIKLSQSAPTQ